VYKLFCRCKKEKLTLKLFLKMIFSLLIFSIPAPSLILSGSLSARSALNAINRVYLAWLLGLS
jgi:hypothetical protein